MPGFGQLGAGFGKGGGGGGGGGGVSTAGQSIGLLLILTKAS